MNEPSYPYPPPPPPQKPLLGVLGIVLISVGCLMTICVIGFGYLVVRYLPEWITSLEETAGPIIETTGPIVNSATPTLIPTIASNNDLSAANETLKSLSQVVIPPNNPIELARIYKGIEYTAPAVPPAPKVYKIGDEEIFWIVNDETDEHIKVTANLAYSTDHLYFWVQAGVKTKDTDVKKLCDTFETKIYPTDREFFGSEWTPGIDNDPHLFILFTKGLGGRIAGYFSSTDSVPPAVEPYSNGHEMFVLNADGSSSLADEYTYSTLAHEFQHMIHWYGDRNEESWLNEGFSELASFLNGYTTGGFDYAFASAPDLQLNDWPNDKNKTMPHYGASFLFVDYFLDRFGAPSTQAVVANKQNGLESIDEVLAAENKRDPLTKQIITADDVFTDWTLANYLKDKTVGDGRFVYTNYPDAPKTKETESVRTCPLQNQNRQVSQYGTDYIRIACRGNYTFSFTGSQEVGVVPANPHSGNYAFWSNKGDESDMSLTQTFDLSKLSSQVTLSYWTWYDLEENYDFVHLVASTDGGKTWEMVRTPSGTEENRTGNNYGWGYNGTSKKWIQEQVDLSKFAGKKLTLRFEYITDAAVNGEGFMLDDIQIPQINYSSDFEKDAGGWQADGFVRMQNRLPQTFRVSLIQDGKPRQVVYFKLNTNNTFSLPLQLSGDAVLVVSGTTRYTRLPASYTFSITP